MYCYKCGKFIETDDTLCPDCKVKVLGEQQPQPNQQVVVISQTTSAQATPVGKAPSNKNGVLSMVFSIVGAIFLGITAAGLDTIIPVVICNTDDYQNIKCTTGTQVVPGDSVMELEK